MKRPAFISLAATPVGMALLFLLIGGTWKSVRLAREHRELATQLAEARGKTALTKPHDEHAQAAEMARLLEEVARESARLAEAKEKFESARKELPEMSGQELRSLGRIEDLARRAAAFIEQVAELGRMLGDKSSAGGNEEVIAQVTRGIGKWAAWIDVIGAMEDTPKEIAELHAATLAERLKLDAASKARLQDGIEREFAALAASGLTRFQRPSDSERQKAWQQQRSESLHAAAARLEEYIPAIQRQPWMVEQSLQLGNAMRQNVNVGEDGHGSMSLAILLPGVQR